MYNSLGNELSANLMQLCCENRVQCEMGKGYSFKLATGKGLFFFALELSKVRWYHDSKWVAKRLKESNEPSGTIDNNPIDILIFYVHMSGLYHMLRLGSTSYGIRPQVRVVLHSTHLWLGSAAGYAIKVSILQRGHNALLRILIADKFNMGMYMQYVHMNDRAIC